MMKSRVGVVVLLVALIASSAFAHDVPRETKTQRVLLDGLTWTYLTGVVTSYDLTKRVQHLDAGYQEGNPYMYACMKSNWCGIPVTAGTSLFLIAGTQAQFKAHHPWRAIGIMAGMTAWRGWDAQHDWNIYQQARRAR